MHSRRERPDKNDNRVDRIDEFYDRSSTDNNKKSYSSNVKLKLLFCISFKSPRFIRKKLTQYPYLYVEHRGADSKDKAQFLSVMHPKSVPVTSGTPSALY